MSDREIGDSIAFLEWKDPKKPLLQTMIDMQYIFATNISKLYGYDRNFYWEQYIYRFHLCHNVTWWEIVIVGYFFKFS